MVALACRIVAMITKRKLRAELSKTQRQLREAADQRDTLLDHCLEHSCLPAGLWGPVHKSVTFTIDERQMHLVAGDTLSMTRSGTTSHSGG